MHNHRRGSAVLTGGGESRARVVYAIIGATALLLGVARFAPSDMTPTAYGASDIGDPSASATGKINPSAVGELSAPSRRNTDSAYRVTYTLPNGERTNRPMNNSFKIGGDTGGLCVDFLGADPGYAKSYTVATTNRITRGNEAPTTYNAELGKKVVNTWGQQIADADYAGIATKSGVPNATADAARIATGMVGWSLQGRSIDDAQVLKRHAVAGRKTDEPELTQLARKIAHAMASQAQSNSASSEKAEPASVKISQGDRTENGDGTVIPISVSGSSDDDKATIKSEGLPSGAKLTDANGNPVNDGDEVSVPSELKLTTPSGTDPGQVKISATTTKTSKLPGGTLLKPADNSAQWVITTQPGKDVPSNATAGINVKWDKEAPSSTSSSSSATSSPSASSSTPKPIVPTSSDSATSSTSPRVTSPSSTAPVPSSPSSVTPVPSTAPSTVSVPVDHSPKISTTVDVDGQKSAEGKPVKVDASKLHGDVSVKDHIDYEGFAPDTKYEFTGTLMKVENGKATPVSGVTPASKVETIGKDGKGTATVDFGKVTDLKPGTQYVVFEKATPLDKSEKPSVDDNGSPKNPSEDKRGTVKHEDAGDDSQTFVTTSEGQVVPPSSGKPVPGKPGAPKETTPAKPSGTPARSGESSTTSSETPALSTDNGTSGSSNGSDNGTNSSDNGGSGSGSNGSGTGSGSSSSHGVGGALASTGANVIWLALLAMILIGAGAGVALWNRRRSHEG